MDSQFLTIADKVRQVLSDSSCGHDYYHAERVFKNALQIQAEEHAGDRYVIGVAALVHDVCRPWEKETGKLHFGEEALERIGVLLEEVAIDSAAIPLILEIVRFHDIYDWDESEEKSIELQIVQDADRLDAIGALGIARTFAFGGANGLVMYEPGENLNFEAAFVEDPSHRTTTVAHFYEKLLKLHTNMNTATGQALGAVRHERMEQFLKDFFAEWNVEKL